MFCQFQDQFHYFGAGDVLNDFGVRHFLDHGIWRRAVPSRSGSRRLPEGFSGRAVANAFAKRLRENVPEDVVSIGPLEIFMSK